MNEILGVSNSVPCTTINKVCSSGLKSVVYGAMSIGLGQSDIVVAGGFESMSNVPFYLNNVKKKKANLIFFKVPKRSFLW